MIFDAVGRLITCDRDRRQVSLRSLANVAIVESVLADNYLGTAFNGPNDLVMDAAGGIYFTDPDYENRNSLPDALYYLSPVGALTQLRTYTASNDRRPNGVILSPDGKVLYLALEVGKRIVAFDVGPDGSLTNDRPFARSDVSISGAPLSPPFGPDGMTIDAAGNVYAAVQNAVFAWNPSGERLFDLPVAQNPQNVEFGGDDGRTLYITAGNSLFGIELNVPSPQLGDYNGDSMVNAADYTVWRNTLGLSANLSADGNSNRVIDAGDYVEWKNQYGTVLGSGAQAVHNSVPEPGLLLLSIGAAVALAPFRRRPRRN
jgi:gluconolactonase